METLITWFDPQPAANERPVALNDPFAEGPPPSLARVAAQRVMSLLREGRLAPSAYVPGRGKMFGVLVVEAMDGRVGFLKSFSGQLEGTWEVEGFVPPVFDRAAREECEVRGTAAIEALTARMAVARAAPEWSRLRAQEEALSEAQAAARSALEARLRANRAQRSLERAEGASEEARAQLARESYQDDLERRRAKASWREQQRPLALQRRRLERREEALDRLRRLVSREVSWRLYDCYRFTSFNRDEISLRALFGPLVPSSGTGDCAAPKLLAFAQTKNLRPLAIAEFWWGAPSEGRVEGAFYPACKTKCGPVLGFLLRGVP